MKTAIFVSALIAATTTFAATGYAMENVGIDSQAKIQRILADQRAATPAPARQHHVMTLSVKKTMKFDRYEAA